MSSSRRSRRCSSFNCSICFCRSLSGSSPPSCRRRSKASRSYGANRMTRYQAGKKNYHAPMRQTEWHIIEWERETITVLRGKQNDTLSSWKENLSHSYRAQQNDTSSSWKEKLTDVMIIMMMMVVVMVMVMIMIYVHNGANRMTRHRAGKKN